MVVRIVGDDELRRCPRPGRSGHARCAPGGSTYLPDPRLSSCRRGSRLSHWVYSVVASDMRPLCGPTTRRRYSKGHQCPPIPLGASRRSADARAFALCGHQPLDPVAEHVAHVFGRAMVGRYHPATPLAQSRTRVAQAVVKAYKASAVTTATSTAGRQRPAVEVVRLALWSCPDCGGPVTNHRHVRCDACIAADPQQTPEIRGKRGAAIASRKRALAEWDEANPGKEYDPEWLRRDILPRLTTVMLSEITEAAGCSNASASDIRRGKWTPHVSTWPVLADLAENG